MDPHPLADLFKRSNYDEPIPSDLDALDYLYKLLPEIHKSENCDEVLHDRSLNKKHGCNDHDWGDSFFDLENLFNPQMNMRLIIVFAILLKVGLEE